MIITLTLNPAIDKTIETDTFEKGTLNHVARTMTHIGGKGINVSFVLKELGASSLAMGLAGGVNGQQIVDGLTQAGIPHFFAMSEKETRVNMKIMESDGTLTELNEAGAEVSEEQLDKLLQEVNRQVQAGDILILSGSVPKGIPGTIYRDLIELAHMRGARTILDADGDLFAYGVEALPDVVKPNREELLRYGKLSPESTEEELFMQAQALLKKGISTVILSMGAQGAVFFDKSLAEPLYFKALSVMVRSAVGAGDSMTAAWAYAMEQQYTVEKASRFAMYVSAAAVTTPGTNPPTRKQIEALIHKVSI